MRRKPELLAPVGSMESLYAAVQNGCDAVYLGGKAFSARAYAANFSLEELRQAVEYTHLYGVKIYVTVNTLYKDSELKPLMEFVENLYNRGVDGVILQDIGISKVIHNIFPDLELHGSTQMTVHNIEGARYLEKIGFTRAVLARELNLQEIRDIICNTTIDVETFIHGALCISYSGQCLMSSLIGGRSGNRGRCAQPCRLSYQLMDFKTGQIMAATPDPCYLMSPKDICTLEVLPDLIQAGIASFKIEGRMKRPEYTASITRIYRKYLDQAWLNPDNYQVDSADFKEITQIFNRGGFSRGYYFGKSGEKLMSYQRPKNWGIQVGKVISYDKKNSLCTVRLTDILENGDGVEIWTSEDSNPGTVVHNLKISGDMATFPIKGKIYPGNPVYRTSQKKLMDELTSSFTHYKRQIEIFGQIILKPGDPILLHLWDQEGNYTHVTGDKKVQMAQKHPLTIEKVEEQISRLGNSPFHLVSLQVEMEGDVFAPISELNVLRRDGIEELCKERYRSFSPIREAKKAVLPISPKAPDKQKIELAVYLRGHGFNPLKYAGLGINRIYLDINQITSALINEIKKINSNIRIFAMLPGIARNREMKEIKRLLDSLMESKLDGVCAGNLGQIELMAGYSLPYNVNFSLNTFNYLTLTHWAECQAESVVLSPELNLKELGELAQWQNISKEIIVYGYLPVMESEYCPVNVLKTQSFCGSGNKYGLLDRKGIVFPIITDCEKCRSLLLNSQPLFLLDRLDEVVNNNFKIFRMDLTIENDEYAFELVDCYLERLQNPDRPLTDKMLDIVNRMQKIGFTRGHFYRGVE